MKTFYEVTILIAAIFVIVLVASILKLYLVRYLQSINQDTKPTFQKGDRVRWSIRHNKRSVIHDIYVGPMNGKTMYLLRNGVRLTRKELLEVNHG